jgi:hypothetical protein
MIPLTAQNDKFEGISPIAANPKNQQIYRVTNFGESHEGQSNLLMLEKLFQDLSLAITWGLIMALATPLRVEQAAITMVAVAATGDGLSLGREPALSGRYNPGDDGIQCASE